MIFVGHVRFSFNGFRLNRLNNIEHNDSWTTILGSIFFGYVVRRQNVDFRLKNAQTRKTCNIYNLYNNSLNETCFVGNFADLKKMTWLYFFYTLITNICTLFLYSSFQRPIFINTNSSKRPWIGIYDIHLATYAWFISDDDPKYQGNRDFFF